MNVEVVHPEKVSELDAEATVCPFIFVTETAAIVIENNDTALLLTT